MGRAAPSRFSTPGRQALATIQPSCISTRPKLSTRRLFPRLRWPLCRAERGVLSTVYRSYRLVSNADVMGGFPNSSVNLEIRANLEKEYADVLTPAALKAIEALAPLDRERKRLMT